MGFTLHRLLSSVIVGDYVIQLPHNFSLHDLYSRVTNPKPVNPFSNLWWVERLWPNRRANASGNNHRDPVRNLCTEPDQSQSWKGYSRNRCRRDRKSRLSDRRV